jgi:hypothetical protein
MPENSWAGVTSSSARRHASTALMAISLSAWRQRRSFGLKLSGLR